LTKKQNVRLRKIVVVEVKDSLMNLMNGIIGIKMSLENLTDETAVDFYQALLGKVNISVSKDYRIK
jgi:hypothetical protein